MWAQETSQAAVMETTQTYRPTDEQMKEPMSPYVKSVSSGINDDGSATSVPARVGVF